MLPESLADEIDRALASGKEFGIVFFPGSDVPYRFGADAKTNGIKMDICPWLGRFSRRITIGSETPHVTTAEMKMPIRSTSQKDYLDGVTNVIANCRKRGGKTVYSRVIVTPRPSLSYGELAARLFAQHPQTMRFVYYTQVTGAWMGATPELLFDYSINDGRIHTMAFAGTRRRGGDTTTWDDKNIRENRFVIDYIKGALQRFATEVQVCDPITVAYGQIEHLCADISATVHYGQLSEIADVLNPTPALCGWPLEEAVSDIKQFELHQRGCYGGFIGFETEHGYTAFVNLRSMQFGDEGCCIYGGGGITSQSVPRDEWEETEAKTALLRNLTAHGLPDAARQ